MHGVHNTKNKHYFYSGKDCVEKFYKDLKELGTEIINFRKKEMIPLINKDIKSYEKQKVCHICKKSFSMMIKTRKEPEIIDTIHNGSTYDYHFVIKKLAEEFKGDFEWLGENTKKFIIFPVPLKKDDGKITYKLKFIDSYRFMQTSLSDLVDNLSYLEFMIKNVKNVWKEKQLV